MKMLKGIEVSDDDIQKWNQALKTVVEEFEKKLVEHEGDFLTGDQPTIADLQFFFELTDLELMSMSFEPFPVMTKWYNKVKAIKEVDSIQEKWAPLTTDAKKAFVK